MASFPGSDFDGWRFRSPEPHPSYPVGRTCAGGAGAQRIVLAVGDVLDQLHQNDFELLIDLIFRQRLEADIRGVSVS